MISGKKAAADCEKNGNNNNESDDNEDTAPEQDEEKEWSPKRQAPMKTKSIPKQKFAPKTAPVSKRVIPKQVELDDDADDDYMIKRMISKVKRKKNQCILAKKIQQSL